MKGKKNEENRIEELPKMVVRSKYRKRRRRNR